MDYRELLIIGIFVFVNAFMVADAWGYIRKGREDEEDYLDISAESKRRYSNQSES